MTRESVSFDRAAGFYDATRKHSPQVTAAQTGALREAAGEDPATRESYCGLDASAGPAR